MKRLVWISAVALSLLTGCNYDEGECWPRSEDDGQVGGGGGPIVPGGGGYGDAPEPKPQGADPSPPGCNKPETQQCGSADSLSGQGAFTYCNGTCKEKCSKVGIGAFSTSQFPFKTVIEDDGTDVAGGWQSATATLEFVRWTGLFPEHWTCPAITVGMPLRTAAHGKVSASIAATLTAAVATQAGANVMDIKPELPQGIFCSKFKEEMKTLFASASLKSYGAKVNQ
jgi:hypothetical protein